MRRAPVRGRPPHRAGAGEHADAVLPQTLAHHDVDSEDSCRYLSGLHCPRQRAAPHSCDALIPQPFPQFACLPAARQGQAATVVGDQVGLVVGLAVPGEKEPGRTLEIAHFAEASRGAPTLATCPACQPDPVRPGQESVWDYPRPPRVEPSSETVEIRVGGRRGGADDVVLPGAGDQSPADLLPPRVRRSPRACCSRRRADRCASGRARRRTSTWSPHCAPPSAPAGPTRRRARASRRCSTTSR